MNGDDRRCPKLDDCPHRFWEPDWVDWGMERLVVPLVGIVFLFLFGASSLLRPVHWYDFPEVLIEVARGPELLLYSVIVLGGAFVSIVGTLAQADRRRLRIRFGLAAAALAVGYLAADRLVTLLTHCDAFSQYETEARALVDWTVKHPDMLYPNPSAVVPYPAGLTKWWMIVQLLTAFMCVGVSIATEFFTRDIRGRLGVPVPDAEESLDPETPLDAE